MSLCCDNVTMGQETLTLNRAESKKVIVVEKNISGHMTNAEGAAALELLCRQVIRLKRRCLTEGARLSSGASRSGAAPQGGSCCFLHVFPGVIEFFEVMDTIRCQFARNTRLHIWYHFLAGPSKTLSV